MFFLFIRVNMYMTCFIINNINLYCISVYVHIILYHNNYYVIFIPHCLEIISVISIAPYFTCSHEIKAQFIQPGA